MSLKYFRFYLDQSETFEAHRYQSILQENPTSRLIRASLDLRSIKKNISILCESEQEIEDEKNQWLHFLEENGVFISQEKTKYESIIEEERDKPRCLHDLCSQDDDHDHQHHDHQHHGHQHEKHWLKAALGLVFGIGLLALSLGGFTIPFAAYCAITAVSAAMTLYLGRNVYRLAWQELFIKKKLTTSSLLYTISSSTILIMSIASLFFPALPMILESAPLILGLWHLGEAIEHSLHKKIYEQLDVRDCAPSLVLVQGETTLIPVNSLLPDDIITINKGEVIPVDVELMQGTELYTTMFDGSPSTKTFQAGDCVKAGMRLAYHIPTLNARVTELHQNSYLSLLAKKIKIAVKEKAPIEETTGKILSYFIPGLLTVAALSAVVIGLLFPPAQAIQCVISILVSACPCALSLITPLAFKIGMRKSSENGAHFKDAKKLQAASSINAVVFDLHGTLTQGNKSVQKLMISDSDRELLKFFLALEKQSEHPAAKSIASFLETAEEITGDESLAITHLDTTHHSGIKATINEETYIIGNRDMLLKNKIQINAPFNNTANGATYLVRGTQIVGQISLKDALRQDAQSTVEKLLAMGKQVYLLTGADTVTANEYAASLGITENCIFSSRGAENPKESFITELQEKGKKVAMIGDAGNDIEAIKKANFGIAIKSSICNSYTLNEAGMVIEEGLLAPIVTAFQVAEKTKKNILQNLFLSLGYNSLITLIASGAFIGLGLTLSPALGVTFMVIESALVFSNLYRLKLQSFAPALPRPEKSRLAAPEKGTTASMLNSLGHQPQPTHSTTTNNAPVFFGKRVLDFFSNKRNTHSATPCSKPEAAASLT